MELINGRLVLFPCYHGYSRSHLQRAGNLVVGELSQVRQDVDAARQRVSRQRKIIKLLREAGSDTRAARSTLASMLETLRLLEKDEQQLEDERYRVA